MPEIKYQIRDWDRLYESAQGRRVDKCRYGCIPNKQDGLQYQRMVRDPERFPLYGAFVAVALCCSKQRMPREGWLTDTGRADGIPYTAADLHVKTGGVPTEIIQEMLNYCSDSACMGTDTWMVRYEDGKAIGAAPRPSAGEKLRRTKKREDQKKRMELEKPSAYPYITTFKKEPFRSFTLVSKRDIGTFFLSQYV